METHQPLLRGGCSCGRNSYAISIPNDATNEAEVIFSGHQDHRHAQGVPLTAWLRVPLTWFRSQTHSFFPDETHATIRRTFTPHYAPHTKRYFCGYCGSPLTFWTDEPESEADFMSVALGSLFGDDLRLLEDLDILPPDDEDLEQHVITETVPTTLVTRTSSEVAPTAPSSSSTSRISYHSGTLAGVPWFEEMIEGSRLGRIMKSRRGIGASEHASTTFEWEISEWQGTDTGRQPTRVFTSITSERGKRKADDMTTI
ncbi:conserved hypothetical protein [Talaromyces stipitatus ATCC 10500]|uniref:CENP-V/GFA domain-containing protein n=1 Tax=Talaromyces stipitatus (strain ATCC 10500 / CBS 375.48 / QM 6759 / NRRL 1006) TaxID=441959 RepID=B8M1X0_TALSN|nr:uncharacterized protein TSTA_085790 [Talaromyces stipitatus ATCC 10500]EED21348.1 conserved hypothetical protein [Talaromyces stipitatus ATCC 10500]